MRPLITRLLAPLIVAVSLAACQTGQGDDGDVVIHVDDHLVTVATFDELAAHLAATTPLASAGPAALRQHVLGVLLAREVLLLEAEATGLLQSPAMASALRQRERELVADLLYRREITDLAVPTADQLDSLYAAWGSGEAVRASHILLLTEAEATSVLGELADGTPFAELARTRSQHAMSAHAGGDMGFLQRGDLLPEMRDPVWSAEPGQVLPAPVHTRMGYHVVKVAEHRHRTFEEMRAELTGEMGRLLRRQQERQLGEQLRVTYGFVWRSRIAAGVIDGELTADGATDTLIAHWDGGTLTVSEYVQHARQHGRRETQVDAAEARQLGEAASLRGLLYTLGIERGATREPEVSHPLRQKGVELAGDALFAQVARNVVVSDSALQRAFEANRSNYRRPPYLRVREILVDDRALADSLAALIRSGADMAELATRYSERVWARPKGGDLGDITEGVPAYAKMARVARDVPVGQLIGPIPSHGGFSMLRVTSRREGEEPTFEASRAAVAQDLRNRAMDAYIDSLRDKHADRIQLYDGALQRTLAGGGTAR